MYNRFGDRNGKYNAKKVTVDGITFDSKGEADRWCELVLLQKAGIVKNLERQVPFELQPSFRKRGKTYRAINYIADFVYERDNIKVVEDLKGFRTKEFALKLKLFEYRYPTLYLEINQLSKKKVRPEKISIRKVSKRDIAGNKNTLEGQVKWS